MTDLVTITVQVPEDRVADLYTYVAHLHGSPLPGNPLLQPWTQEDMQLAQQVYEACSPSAQKVVKSQLERPPTITIGSDS